MHSFAHSCPSLSSGRQVLWNSLLNWRRSIDRVEHEDRTTLDLEGQTQAPVIPVPPLPQCSLHTLPQMRELCMADLR